jgi:nitrate/TMAO reductase-like tetraheme cytochrome c subunit
MKQTQRLGRIDIRLLVLTIGLILIVAALTAITTRSAVAAPSSQGEPDNEFCLGCHSNPAMSKAFPNGDVLSLYIDSAKFTQAVHWQEGIACITCHMAMEQVPHPELTAQTKRDAKYQLYTICQECHFEQYNNVLDSVHQTALAGGNKNAAICTDCHNPHTQTRITNKETGEILLSAHLAIPQTCAQCHSAIYDAYKESVHGKALTEYGNLDVPTCIDCHGVHNIQDPTTALFRNDTPLLCAKCHTNETLMEKYGISTNVLSTYVADFHGTTVTLFEETNPNLPTNKPVCTDCHGIHDIKNVNDPTTGIALKKNLLVKCQRCHPDATANFPDSWMSHYQPSAEVYPIVYFVNLFYKILIPTVLGGMGLFVLTDIYRRFIAPRIFRKKEGSH